MTRILVLVPGLALTDRDPAPPLDADVVLAWRAVPAVCAGASAAERAVAEVAMLEAGLGAERERFDAVVIDSFADVGLKPLRAVLGIPVVGPGRTALLHALTLGGRFGIVAPRSGLEGARAALRDAGLEGRCAALIAAEGEGEDLADAARACLAAGAQAICLGDTRLDPAGVRAAVPIPVVAPLPLAIAFAENLLALGLRHSPRAHPAPMVRKDDLLAGLARAAEAVNGGCAA